MDSREMMEEANKAQSKTIHEFQLTFGTIEGKEVLKYLENTLEGSVLSPNCMMDIQASINPADCAFIREGQNQVLRHIKTILKGIK